MSNADIPMCRATPCSVRLPMLVELIAQLTIDAGVACVDATPVQIVHIASCHERELGGERSQIGGLQTLRKACSLRCMLLLMV